MSIRLQKLMADSGVASRRKCEEMILEGRVKVNGQIVDKLGTKVDLEKDIVEVDGKKITIKNKNIYIMLNKPFGVITSAKDEKGRKTVIDIIKDRINERIFPVGRLDFDTSGLLILTNDGEFAYKVTHPKHNIEKTYIATVKGIPSEDSLDKLRNGVEIDGRLTQPAIVNSKKIINGNMIIEIKIHEGRNRQIRKMFSAIGHDVIRLKRVAIGKLQLGRLKEGEFRFLSTEELELIYKE
ncbi:pseudouridine synthase [Caldicellulosiruptoraceae bacterium PP1]